jgi:hypothetical protein
VKEETMPLADPANHGVEHPAVAIQRRISELETLVSSMRDTLIGAEVVIRMLAPTGQKTTLETIRRAIERAK